MNYDVIDKIALKEKERELKRKDPYYGFKDTSPRTGQMDWISDDLLHDTLHTHNPLWRYIVNRYTKEWDCPLNIIGYGSIPMAIELSQWTYPVTFIADNEKELKQAKIDAAAQAGFFELKKTDYWRFIPRARVTVFTGLLNHFKKRKDIHRWLDMALKRSYQIVCAVRRDRDWKSALGNRYRVDGLWYNYGKYLLLTIERR